jgi:hypothetical protein
MLFYKQSNPNGFKALPAAVFAIASGLSAVNKL